MLLPINSLQNHDFRSRTCIAMALAMVGDKMWKVTMSNREVNISLKYCCYVHLFMSCSPEISIKVQVIWQAPLA